MRHPDSLKTSFDSENNHVQYTQYCLLYHPPTKKWTLYMTARGAMKCVSMLCKLGCVHAFSRRLQFLKPQQCQQVTDAAGLSKVFEGFAHLFGLVLWTHRHGPRAV